MEQSVRQRIPTIDDRRDLLRSLTAWTGRFDVAEDLVQQTLYEAWRSGRQPARDDEWRPWLFGVARNVLLRWRRAEAKHSLLLPNGPEDGRFLDIASTDDDLEAMLTDSELVALLDDLLGRLPSETRTALILKYVAELPQAEVAKRLGIHEKALEGRLHRGRQALKRTLIVERPDTAIELGLVSEPNVWKEIDLYCPSCGVRHLSGRWFDDGGLQITCRDCATGNDRWEMLVERGRGARRIPVPRPSLARATNDMLALWSPVHRDGIWTKARCMRCSSPVTPRLEYPQEPPYAGNKARLHLVFECFHCHHVGSRHTVAGSGVLIAEGQSFWKRHRLICSEPPQLVRWRGTEAIESCWRSADGHRYSAWYGASTGALLAIDENGIQTHARTV